MRNLSAVLQRRRPSRPGGSGRRVTFRMTEMTQDAEHTLAAVTGTPPCTPRTLGRAFMKAVCCSMGLKELI
jgi:hypothetical protein